MQNFSLKTLLKKTHIKALVAAGGLVGIVCIGFIVFNMMQIMVGDPAASQEEASEQPVYRNPFTGELLTEEFTGGKVACVMVENSADAWPLSGVEDAFLVIEAPVEGNIPRFMACYTEGVAADETIQKIGPVRSARPYYVSWASGFGALYAHVGGSPDALARLAMSDDVTDLNEFWNTDSFWRDNGRYAPHNAYTSSAFLWAAADRLALQNAQEPGWHYAYDEKLLVASCDDIVLPWNGSIYGLTWTCDRETKNYVRMQGDGEAESSDGDFFVAQNVIVMETDVEVLDAVGRLDVRTEGMGNALVCTQGQCADALWYKEGVDKPLQFYTAYPHEPVVFTPGKTWIEVVSAGHLPGNEEQEARQDVSTKRGTLSVCRDGELRDDECNTCTCENDTWTCTLVACVEG